MQKPTKKHIIPVVWSPGFIRVVVSAKCGHERATWCRIEYTIERGNHRQPSEWGSSGDIWAYHMSALILTKQTSCDKGHTPHPHLMIIWYSRFAQIVHKHSHTSCHKFGVTEITLPADFIVRSKAKTNNNRRVFVSRTRQRLEISILSRSTKLVAATLCLSLVVGHETNELVATRRNVVNTRRLISSVAHFHENWATIYANMEIKCREQIAHLIIGMRVFLYVHCPYNVNDSDSDKKRDRRHDND